MLKVAIRTDTAPAAIGPYSQALRSGDLLFLSGQIPLDPATGALVDGNIEEQTQRVMNNLEAVLRAAGASFEDVVKTTIYLTDLGDFGAMNEVYAGFFGEAPPARATLQVAALPKGARVEIDAIARLR
jgi:2-iminobutanoate/2-iminopropanoate deaminase